MEEKGHEFYCRYYMAILNNNDTCNKCTIRCVHSGSKEEQDI